MNDNYSKPWRVAFVCTAAVHVYSAYRLYKKDKRVLAAFRLVNVANLVYLAVTGEKENLL